MLVGLACCTGLMEDLPQGGNLTCLISWCVLLTTDTKDSIPMLLAVSIIRDVVGRNEAQISMRRSSI